MPRKGAFSLYKLATSDDHRQAWHMFVLTRWSVNIIRRIIIRQNIFAILAIG